jgi:O-antigen/teichoic acid export membrane protein
MSGQAIFLLSGFLVNSGLGRILGPADYGLFSVVMAVLVIVELFVITGIPELIQKFGGERPETMPRLIRETLPWQTLLSVLLFVGFWIAAPFIAAAFGNTKMTVLLRVAGIDIIVYGLYKYFLGVQNGLHRFGPYTALGITYSLAKLVSIFALVWMGFSVKGALIGNMLGSVFALGLALLFLRMPKSDEELESIPYGSFVIQNMFYFVGLNALFSIDLLHVEYFLSAESVGYYSAAAVFAKLTYLFSVALSAVLLPSLARALKQNQSERAAALTKDSLRYVIIFLLLINIIVGINAEGIITLFFGSRFLAAAPILLILIVGLSFVTMMAVINTIMIAQNRMLDSMIMVVALVAIDVVLNRLLIPQWRMVGAAAATSVTGLLGTIAACCYVFKEIRSIIISWSLLRLAAVTIAIILASRFFWTGTIAVFVNSVIIGVLYLVLLWLSREITAVDLQRLKESIGMAK